MIFSEKHNACFADDRHLGFYTEQTDRLKPDCYLKALIYTLGICDDTRRRFDSIYDAKDRSIVPETLYAEWQTSGSMKVTRLAFQLFTDTTPTARTYDEAKNRIIEDYDECKRYSVSDIFCCGYAPYFYEAIKLRYPEYLRERIMYAATKAETAQNESPQYNHLAAAEMDTEGNYNMIDGIINNEKPSILDHMRQFKPLPNERGGKPERAAALEE